MFGRILVQRVRSHVCKSIGLLVTTVKQTTKQGSRAVNVTATLTEMTVIRRYITTQEKAQKCVTRIHLKFVGPSLYVVRADNTK
jgi:transcription antitermination factor NusA-like protein